LREAVVAARKMNGVSGYLELESPATGERLRGAVGDWIGEMGRVERKEGEKGFFVTVA
jgi:xanthine dehydrogenase/oxidase